MLFFGPNNVPYGCCLNNSDYMLFCAQKEKLFMKRYTHLDKVKVEIFCLDNPIDNIDEGEFNMCVFYFFEQMVKYYEENNELYKEILKSQKEK